jgi:IS5 family transposase
MAPFQGLILCVLLVAEYRGVGAWSVMIGPLKVAAEGLEKRGLLVHHDCMCRGLMRMVSDPKILPNGR